MKKLFITIALLTLIACGGDTGTTFQPDSVWRGTWNRSNEATTPKGVKVYSERDINTALFPHIDTGIDKLAVSARLENYIPLNHNEFIVALFKRSRYCINPGFLVQDHSNTWDGTIYDKDPKAGSTWLCAAGLHPGMNVMVVADDQSHMSNIVQWEGEHIVLLRRDPARWAATSGIHSHPIFRQPDGLAVTEVQDVTVGGFKVLLTK